MGDSPSIRQRAIAKRLTAWREGYEGAPKQGVVAKMVGWSAAKQSRLENAEQTITPADVMSLALALQVPEDERTTLFNRCQASMEQGWWDQIAKGVFSDDYRDYIELEADTTLLRVFRLDVVHALFQTHGYAVATGTRWNPDKDAVTRGVETRIQRQGRLSDEDFRVHAVLAEGALYGLANSPEMREQRETLLKLARLPGVDIRVLTSDAGPPPAAASFSILSFNDDDPDVGYVELPGRGVFLEDEEEVGHFRLAFDRLWGDDTHTGLALSSQDSLDFIAAIDK